MRCSGVLCNHGFSLIELLIVIVVVGILTSIAMQSMDVAIDNARRNRTEQEMEMLADAIVGDPSQMQSSVRCDFGYVGDVGAFPSNLQALYRNPGGYATWDGPYVRSGFSEDSTGFKTDEWGTLYSYSGGAEISSTGSGSTITKKIADATNDYLLNTLRGTIKDAGNEPPGFVYADSIDIVVSIPDGSGSTANKTYKPDASGVFTLDSLPAGQHPLRIIYEPTVDTLFRYVTILPRHKSRPAYRFATAYFSDTSGSEMSSALTLSATNSATLGGLVFANEDLIKYDPDADTASMLFDGSTAFSANEDVDAVCLLANGHIVLSTAGSATIGSLSFFNEDLVNYDPSTGTATMFFDGGTVFSDNEDIDAVHILENGHVVLSTAGPATIGSLSFEERDLVNYDPAADTATVLFDGSEVFADEADVNAAHILDNGHIIISTNANESIGSLSFGNEDLVECDLRRTSMPFISAAALSLSVSFGQPGPAARQS